MYRTIDTAVWDDPWFADLEPDAKLFFLYLITNRRGNACGAYEVTERQMAFEIGYPYPIHTLWEPLRDRVKWYPEHRIVWVRNFYRHNCHSPKMTISARGHVARLPVEIRREIVDLYPELAPDEDTLSIGYAKGTHTHKQVKGKEEGKEEGKGKAKDKGRARVDYPPEFEEFWSPCPRKEPSKAKAFESWEKAIQRATPEEIQAGLERYLPVWARFDDPTKIPHVTTWLNQDRWTVEQPMGPPRASPSNGHTTGGKTFSELAKEAEARDESRRNGQGVGSHPGALLADLEGGRERPRTDAGNLDSRTLGRAIDAVYRERP